MLGKLEKVDLDQIWKNEAYNFTPWLGLKENLELIGNTIGIELELEAQEKSVGPFRAELGTKHLDLIISVMVKFAIPLIRQILLSLLDCCGLVF